MLNISVSFFNILSEFVQTFVPSVTKFLNARCNRGVSHCNNIPARSFLINNAFSAVSKLRSPNMYCWSHKTLVTILWTHLRVNLICIKSFCPQKRITARCLLWTISMAMSPYLMFINVVTVTSS